MIDTYEELKQETTAKSEEAPSPGLGSKSQLGGEKSVEAIMRMSMATNDNPHAGAAAAGQGGGLEGSHNSTDLDHNQHAHRA